LIGSLKILRGFLKDLIRSLKDSIGFLEDLKDLINVLEDLPGFLWIR